MDVVVNDTNIFLDLLSVELLEDVFKLPLRFHTVDYVIAELIIPEQKDAINHFVDLGKLIVKEFSENEFIEIINMYMTRQSNISVTDCSVWYYAKKNDYRLLTGDGKLRSSATADGVIVSGVLYLTDMLVDCGIVPPKDMAEKLRKLCLINKRLPQRLIDERISNYEDNR